MVLRRLGGRRLEWYPVSLLPVIGCTESASGDVLGVPCHLRVPHGPRQGHVVGALVVHRGSPGSTLVTEGPRAVLRTSPSAAKADGSQIVGPHPSDRQMEFVDTSGLLSAVLMGGTSGCCIPGPLIDCDGHSGSISAGPRYDLILSGDALSTRDPES